MPGDGREKRMKRREFLAVAAAPLLAQVLPAATAAPAAIGHLEILCNGTWTKIGAVSDINFALSPAEKQEWKEKYSKLIDRGQITLEGTFDLDRDST